MGIKERSKERRKRMAAYRAANFEAAEQWGLDFYQKKIR
jgi:hypothetical protein